MKRWKSSIIVELKKIKLVPNLEAGPSGVEFQRLSWLALLLFINLHISACRRSGGSIALGHEETVTKGGIARGDFFEVF